MTIVPQGPAGDVLTPADTVRVVARLRALTDERIDRDHPAGDTVADIARGIYGDVVPPLIVHLTDADSSVPLAPHVWHRVRPKPGTTLTMRPALQDDAWRVIAQIAIVVAAVAIAVFAPPLIGAFAAALLAAGVAFAGNLAINALFPVAAPQMPADLEKFASLPSIAGAQNAARPYEPIPVVLGRHRISPYVAASAYTEIVGTDTYLRLLLTAGYGPVNITDIRIGETPISAFDLEYEYRYGLPGDSEVSLYRTDVDQQELAIELRNDGAGTAPWETRTTSPNTDAAVLDLTAPEGIFQVNETLGVAGTYFVNVHARYRPAGGTESDWVDLGLFFAFAKEMRTGRATNTISFPARGQYDVALRRMTGEAPPSVANRTHEKVVWTALRSQTYTVPISFPKPLSKIAMFIRASGELSGEINTINCIASSMVTAWSGTAWEPLRESSWPPDLYRHVLQGAFNARPVPDAQIDLENLRQWWAYCVDEGFKYNAVIATRRSIWSLLLEIAAAGRAVPTFINGKWGVIWDRPTDPVVQHFHPRNSWGFSGSRVYPRMPHALRCRFINAANGWSDDERLVFDDGYSEGNATLFESFEFPGVTDADLIWRHARFQIAQARLRPEQFVLNCDWEGLVCQRGDRVRVAHDAALIGLGAGRVKAVTGQQVVLDEVVVLEGGTGYGIRFRLADGSFVYRSIATEGPAETDTVDLVGISTMPAAGDAYTFGEADRDSAIFRVFSIENQNDLVARLTLVDDAPEISQADQGAIPPYDPHVTAPVDPLTLPPGDLHATEAIEGYGPSVRAVVRLSWRLVRTGYIRTYEVQERDDDTSTKWVTVGTVSPPANTIDVPLPNPGVRSYRVRALFNNGGASAWTTLAGLNFAGLSLPPANVTNLHERDFDGQTHLAWTPVVDPRIAYYEVRKGVTWDTALTVASDVIQQPWPTTGDGTYWVNSYVLSPYGARVYALTPASLQLGGSVKIRNIILTRDELATGWTGALDGGVIDGSFIRTNGSALAEAFALEAVADLGVAGVHIAVYVSAVTVDVGSAKECRFKTDFDAAGTIAGDSFLDLTDVLGSSDILSSASNRFVRAYPIWRFSTEGETDVFAPADVFGASDVFSGNITWPDWVSIASGVRKARYFQPGLVLVSSDAGVRANGVRFEWFVDVPDRIDNYTALTIPAEGLSIEFYDGGFTGAPASGETPTPFRGGPKSSGVPNVLWSIVPAVDAGDAVEVRPLTTAGCTIKVKNAAGTYIARSGVNLRLHGY